MGSLRNISTGGSRRLESEHLIGRAATCSLQLNERFISAQHALLRWTGFRWEVKDLGSRNGTFVDGTRLKAGEEHSLRIGSRIAFGRSEMEWELVDESPPGIMVVPLGGGDAIQVEGDLLALPSSEDPMVTLYRSDGHWVLERPDESLTPITNLQTFDVAGSAFRFCCPDSPCLTSLADPTLANLLVDHLQLSFSVSSDEEYVQLQMSCGAASFELGARGHNYLLLTLARRRLEDAAQGLPEASCGWIYQDDLAHDPSMAPPQLNIDVFRIRKQFAAVGVADAANIIERRPRTRQLRIGTGHVSVVRL
jgi:hypothetical protein